MKGINWLGVVLALVAGQLIGFAWYGFAFSEQWMALMGFTAEQIEGEGMMGMLYGALGQLITAIGLGWLVARLGEPTLMGGLKAALAACVFFAATTNANRFIYGMENPGLIPIDFGYLFIVYLAMGAVIGAVRLKPRVATLA
ncbi:MAG TPA: DUF1761 domain-containing protein [Phenylobacterium sp.]|nr:DUF1761 domain-containing protein [Phenylobacterium sp.]